VLPEDLCEELAFLAQKESRTVSNMAKVLIQDGVKRFKEQNMPSETDVPSIANTERFRSDLEAQEPRRLRGAPRRLKFYRQN
tara:strand:+ start:30678 stop:30923 length:246 start_codon:yes stop_codon:yes gene_type:complete